MHECCVRVGVAAGTAVVAPTHAMRRFTHPEGESEYIFYIHT